MSVLSADTFAAERIQRVTTELKTFHLHKKNQPETEKITNGKAEKQ